MANETNAKYYVLCRCELNESPENIHQEIVKLFKTQIQISLEQIQVWSNEYLNNQKKAERYQMIKFDYTCTNFDVLNFKLINTDASNIKHVQFYSLCRHQLDIKPKVILNELLMLFDGISIDLFCLNKWLLNLSKDNFSIKSFEINEEQKMLRLSIKRIEQQQQTKKFQIKQRKGQSKLTWLQLKLNERNSIKKLNEKLNNDLENAKIKIFELQDNLAYLAGNQMITLNNQTNKQQFQQLTTRINELENELNLTKDDSLLSNQINDLKRDLIEQTELNKQLINHNKQLESELDEFRNQFNFNNLEIDLNFDDLLSKSNNFDLNSLKEKYELEINSLNERVQEYKLDSNNFRYKCEDLERENTSLKDIHQGLLNLVQKYEKKTSDSQHYFDEIKLAVEQHNLERAQLNDQQIQIENLKNQLEQIKNELINEQFMVRNLNYRISDQNDEIQHLILKHKSILEDNQIENERIHRKYNFIRDDYYDLKITHDSLIAKYENLKYLNGSYLNELNDLKKENSKLAIELEQLKTSNKRKLNQDDDNDDEVEEDIICIDQISL